MNSGANAFSELGRTYLVVEYSAAELESVDSLSEALEAMGYDLDIVEPEVVDDENHIEGDRSCVGKEVW